MARGWSDRMLVKALLIAGKQDLRRSKYHLWELVEVEVDLQG